MIFPDYPDGNGYTGENSAKKKKPTIRFLIQRGVRIPPKWWTSKPCGLRYDGAVCKANRFPYSCFIITARRKILRRAVMVDESGLAPESYGFCQSFLHTYSAFSLAYLRRRTGTDKGKPLKYFFKRAVKRLKKFAV